MRPIPEKEYYRVGEVCELTGTQPYVLRFWESEFPQLHPARNRTGHPVYSRRDLDVVLRIRKLLHEDEYTLADARARLAAELSGASEFAPDGARPSDPVVVAESEKMEAAQPDAGPDLYEIRTRYADACTEIARLQEELRSERASRSGWEQSQRELLALRERVAELEKATGERRAPPGDAGVAEQVASLERALAAERASRHEVADRLEVAVAAFRERLEQLDPARIRPVS